MIKAESREGGFADGLYGLLSRGAVKLRHPIEVVSAKGLSERILKVLLSPTKLV